MPDPVPLQSQPAGVVLAEREGLAIAGIQARRGRVGELVERVRERFGLELLDGPKRVAAGPIAFVGIGPGKWLAVDAGGDPAFVAGLARDLAGVAAVVDQSDGHVLVRVTGAHARDALQKAVPLDLHPRAFGPGAAACTILAQIGVVLWQLDDAPGFEVAAPHSFMGSFRHALHFSAAEFGVATSSGAQSA
jgi:sarcosine oxidase subunit gamma